MSRVIYDRQQFVIIYGTMVV